MAEPVVLVARYTVKAGHLDRVLEALGRMAPLVRAHEPGCLTYQVNRATDDEHTLLLYEEYADDEALAAHTASPYFKEIILETVVPLLVRRQREFFRPVLR